jgi:hypothetical protein
MIKDISPTTILTIISFVQEIDVLVVNLKL